MKEKKTPSKAALRKAREKIDRAYREKFNPAWGTNLSGIKRCTK